MIAGELPEAGRRVLLLEAGPYKTAADYMRWEARANHELRWPIAWAEPAAGAGRPMPLFRGRLVGGTTSINTKVALRPLAEDYRKWHEAAGLLGAHGGPFTKTDLLPHLERVEKRLGVRARDDWQQCVRTVAPAFRELGAELESVMSYTDENCMRWGSCLQGCPTNAGKNTLNVYIQPALVHGDLELRPGADVRRVLIEDSGDGPVATGVRYVDADGIEQARIDGSSPRMSSGARAPSASSRRAH